MISILLFNKFGTQRKSNIGKLENYKLELLLFMFLMVTHKFKSCMAVKNENPMYM